MEDNNELFKVYGSGFVQISNEVFRDTDISLKAKGLLGYLLTHDYNLYKLKKSELPNLLKEGRTSINNAWAELTKLGYIKTVRKKRDDGKFKYVHHISPVARFLHTVNPSTENLSTEKPSTENVHPLEYYKKNTKEEIEKEISKEKDTDKLTEDWDDEKIPNIYRERYKKFMEYVRDNCERITKQKMKPPSLSLFVKMIEVWGADEMKDVVLSLENSASLKKYVNLGLTMHNWLRKRETLEVKSKSKNKFGV